MKKVVLICLALLACTLTQAQDTKTLLNEVSAKVKSYDNIAIDFKYNLNNSKEKVNQDTRGNVTLKGENYVLNMLGTSTIFDGAKTYTIVPEDEEVTISAISDQDENAITPSKMLSFFNDGYTQKMDISQKVKGRTIQYVKLTPMDSNSEVKHTLLGIDTATKHIYRLIIVQKNETKITITVNSFKPNQPLSKNAFVFDKSKYQIQFDYYGWAGSKYWFSIFDSNNSTTVTMCVFEVGLKMTLCGSMRLSQPLF